MNKIFTKAIEREITRLRISEQNRIFNNNKSNNDGFIITQYNYEGYSE